MERGVLAGQFHTLLNYGNPPWGLMATLGSSYSMRGYYEGRYRDKCAMDAQIELRQHVWRRNGVAVWAGAGTVFLNSPASKLNISSLIMVLVIDGSSKESKRKVRFRVWKRPDRIYI